MLIGRKELLGGTLVRVVPLLPLRPGIAINSACYAEVLWLPVCTVIALRRLAWRRRGLCPRCGYDLRGGDHPACPECGTGQLRILRQSAALSRARRAAGAET